MTSKFLKAKHWQLFALIFGLPLVLQGIAMSKFSVFIQTLEMMEASGDVSPTIVIDSMVDFVGIIMIVVAFVGSLMFGWFWSVGLGLQHKIPEGLRMKTGLFKAALILPAVYFAIFFGVIGFIFINSANLTSMNFSEELIFRVLPAVISLHLLSIGSIIYALIFVAKTIKIAEVQRKIKSDEFIGEFFLIWFFIIGVWFLQPKINEIYEFEIVNHEID